MPGLVMAPLARTLERAGWRCHLFVYSGRGADLRTHAERLVGFARVRAPAGAHFVGHSLGGLVILRALDDDRALAVGRVVLLGTPARGSLAGRRLARFRVGRWLLGTSTSLWGETVDIQTRWTRPEPLGVIAGTRPYGAGAVIACLPRPHDGVVRVEETTVAGMSERILLRVGHSEMLISARVATQVETFLRLGRFLA